MSVTALLWQEPIREELKLSYSNWYICAVAVPTKNCRADRVSMCVCVCVMCEAHTYLVAAAPECHRCDSSRHPASSKPLEMRCPRDFCNHTLSCP